ncbi:nicotinate phosphoribosyltransferase [Pseudomonas phage Phabio]|uniref:Nicotinamide phosphoribosyltransferase n=1 Tax=Pseudomonas phage Phabio TaxID=2006668 RepID=A0A1Y0T0G2_9CAUD|nr:nicotinamide phosphoribosyl transferase [Pseudomonas phage Phabio]ARV76978.1 nicotinate phosphoribosyltransferase [Pseudomonas phage Phabio]
MSTNFQLFAPTVADGYKMGHGPLYPQGTAFAYGNGTPRADRLFRGSKSESMFWDSKVVWFGIQAVLREIHGIWDSSFFKKDKGTVIRRYKRRMETYLGKGLVDIEAMERLHDLGYLPVTILSIPEGSRLNMNVPGYVIYNTIPEFYWVVNYLETVMSSLIWAMVCNTTIAYEYRRVLDHFAHLTGSPIEGVDFQGHDFALRGINNPFAAAFSNAGHLVFFKGTDTLPAIDFVEDMYFADAEKEFIAASVVATEHAVATSNILYKLALKLKAAGKTEADYTADELNVLKLEAEREFIIEVITEKVPTGIISLVSDSFDFWGVLTNVLPTIKEAILGRKPDANGLAKVVIRPDSGDPVEVICGREILSMDEWRRGIKGNRPLVRTEEGVICEVVLTRDGYDFTPYELSAEEKGAVQVLWETFGGTVNDKGYKVLHERIGLIYGDSITVDRTQQIMRRLMKKGFASCNWVLGIGSYTYQHNTRDTFGFAVKATAIQVEDLFVELFKAPKTEGETNKKSAKGFLKVVKDEFGNFLLEQNQTFGIDEIDTHSGELRPIYKDGKFLNEVTFEQVRAVANAKV